MDEGPASKTSLKILEMAERIEDAIKGVDKRLQTIESKQRFQEADVDILVHALQEVLIELQLPGTAERLKARAEQRARDGMDAQ